MPVNDCLEPLPTSDQMNSRLCPFKTLVCLFLSSPILTAQVIQEQSAEQFPGEQHLEVSETLPDASLTAVTAGEVSLLPGLFRDRRELTKAYLLRLKTENIWQNHRLEAGEREDRPSELMHQGWEAPHYQVRGQFGGHWLAAAALFAATDSDEILGARADEAVAILQHCQELNGGQWVASIPTKYFDMLEAGRPIWSPQYPVHKTLMGLLAAYQHRHDEAALQVLENAADWFVDWTERLIREGHGKVVYGGECGGMLELWSDLYSVSGDERYLRLASRYAMPDLFPALLDGRDTLSNEHSNAGIPWIQGAARLYEVTGDVRYRSIVEAFWKVGVEERGMFATTGNNAGEFWIPPHQFGRFLSARTQEHCTVYNMIRVAVYLFRWTGEAHYADYIERALYNGILAQQNPHTGMVSYFLPLEPGAHKVWGSETKDFWCCYGTLVQAQAMYENLIYYRADDGITVSQFIPSDGSFDLDGGTVRVRQTIDSSDRRKNFSRSDNITRWIVELAIKSETDTPWTLRIRRPGWSTGEIEVTIDGESAEPRVSPQGFLEIERNWSRSTVRVAFSKRVVQEALPGDERRFALIDGPVVLAALTEQEPELKPDDFVTPQYEHVYESGRAWQSSHYLLSTDSGSVSLVPLFEVSDETYSVYMTKKD